MSLYFPVPQYENVALSGLPAYLGGYQYCRVAHTDPNSGITYEQLISNEDASLLRKLHYIHKKGLRIDNCSFLEKALRLEYKGLVSRRSGRFYITPKAENAEYTLVPRLIYQDRF